MRHAAGAVLTASIDRLDFMSPVQVGEIVVLQAQVNYTSRTSMEVGCRVETEDMHTGTRRYVTKAYLTFVAVDEHGRPRPVASDQARHRRGPPPPPRRRAPAYRAPSGRRETDHERRRRSLAVGPHPDHRRRPGTVPPGPDHRQRRAPGRWRARLGRDPEPEGTRARPCSTSAARAMRSSSHCEASTRRQDSRTAREVRGHGRRRVRAADRTGPSGVARSRFGVDRAVRRRRRSARGAASRRSPRSSCGSTPASCATAATSTRTTSRSRPRSRRFSTTRRAATSARSRCSASTPRATRHARCAASSSKASHRFPSGRGDQAPREGPRR